jgi:hypothetical protein
MTGHIGPLITLVYVSTATRFFDAATLEALLEGSRRRNTEAGVTGLLVYSDGNIMQCLEGPRDAVDSTFARLARDRRHFDVTVLVRETIPAREFPDWSMAHSTASAPEFLKLRGADWGAGPHNVGRELLRGFWDTRRGAA